MNSKLKDPVLAELQEIRRVLAREDAVAAELKQIKRLLALVLVRDGAPQNPVAKAAGIRTATINQLAKGIGRSAKIGNGMLKD